MSLENVTTPSKNQARLAIVRRDNDGDVIVFAHEVKREGTDAEIDQRG